MPKPKRSRGRPSKYDPAFIAKVDEYIAKNQDEYYEFHKTRGDRSDSYERKIIVRLPTRDGFAIFLGVVRQTLDNWANDHPDFLDAVKKIDFVQKERLVQNGLSGEYNPLITKLLLSANHDVVERSATDITSKGEKIGGADAVIAAIDSSRKAK